MRSVLFVCLLLACLNTKAVAAERLDVAVSIPPLHSLVAAVMDGVATPHLIIPGSQSPHAFSLKPSGARALQRAKLVFWVGPQLESSLMRPIRKIARSARVVEVAKAKGIELLELREGKHNDGHDHNHGHNHGHEANDMHLWLSPKNAIAMIPVIVGHLGSVWPDLAERFGTNGKRAAARLSDLDEAMHEKLSNVREARFAVFHDAFQYFERAFGLRAPLVINLSPEHRPSAARVRKISNELTTAGIRCVFAEPQFSARHLNAYANGKGRTLATIDPLGADFQPGKDLYFQMMHALADGIAGCLQSK